MRFLVFKIQVIVAYGVYKQKLDYNIIKFDKKLKKKHLPGYNGIRIGSIMV